MDDLQKAFEPVRTAARKASWPGVEEGESYGTPALRVQGRILVRLRDPDVLVLRCDIEEKPFLIKSAPDVYFETEHYKSWPAILVNLKAISQEELRERLEKSWRSLASKGMLRRHNRRLA